MVGEALLNNPKLFANTENYDPFEIITDYIDTCRASHSDAVIIKSVRQHVKNFLRCLKPSFNHEFRAALESCQSIHAIESCISDWKSFLLKL